MLERIKDFGQSLLNYRRPPGPSFLDILDEGIQDECYWLLKYPLKCAKKYGDIFYLSNSKKFIAVGAKAFEYILKTNHFNFIRDEAFYKRNMQPFFGNSVIVNSGEFWRERRRLVQPYFQKASFPKHFPLILEYGKQFIEEFFYNTSTPKVDIQQMMNLMTFYVTSKLFCHLALPLKEYKRLEKNLQFCNHYSSTSVLIPFRYIPSPGNIRFYRYSGEFDQLLLKHITERRNSSSHYEDLLDLLMHSPLPNTNTFLSDTEILAELKTHLLTGFETSACALSWMWYLLGKHPDYYDAMLKEIDDVFQHEEPTLEGLSHLTLTKAIFEETVRLYPPSWTFIRKSLSPDTVLGVNIPQGGKIMLNIYALHRNPDYWENPNDFKPERFLSKKPSHPFAYLPFGGGPHMCIGSHMAVPEVLTLISLLSQRYRFHLSKQFDPNIELCISLRPSRAIKMQPKKRSPTQIE